MIKIFEKATIATAIMIYCVSATSAQVVKIIDLKGDWRFSYNNGRTWMPVNTEINNLEFRHLDGTSKYSTDRGQTWVWGKNPNQTKMDEQAPLIDDVISIKHRVVTVAPGMIEKVQLVRVFDILGQNVDLDRLNTGAYMINHNGLFVIQVLMTDGIQYTRKLLVNSP